MPFDNFCFGSVRYMLLLLLIKTERFRLTFSVDPSLVVGGFEVSVVAEGTALHYDTLT